MPKEEYLDSLTAKMRNWRKRIDATQDNELGQKYEEVVDLLTSYERMGAGAWSQEERALDQACSELEQALPRTR